MKLVAKAVLYIAFAYLAVISLQRVRRESARTSLNDRRLALAGGAEETRRPAVSPDAATTLTNQDSTTLTNLVDAAVTNAAAGEGATNGAPGGTLEAAGAGVGRKPDSAPSTLGWWIAGFVVSLLGLAGLIGWDFAVWTAARSNRLLGVDVEAPKDRAREYEAAEEEWTKGNHLDAITMMREYLQKNPSEQYVALRIAEIYEKDLGNYLAAALEYEEVLKKHLPREKWGWTALRLSNLYSGRLNQPDRSIALLEQVAAEYPETAAAKKARERLGLPEPTEEPVGEMDVNPIPTPPEASGVGEDSSLPSGFRRKK